jgi:hypothetical protein
MEAIYISGLTVAWTRERRKTDTVNKWKFLDQEEEKASLLVTQNSLLL